MRLHSQPESSHSGPGSCADEGGAYLGARLGVKLEVTRHRLLEQRCACGHTTAKRAHVSPDDALWPRVQLGEHRLLGPRLAAVVVTLCMRLRGSRRRVQELLYELFGLELSVGLIDQTLREAGRAAEGHQDQLTKELLESVLVHADETPWLEHGHLLWLWVFCSVHTALYVIGARTAEMLANVLSNDNFAGVLMSDGYTVYRVIEQRLRCWPHLLRKLKGLADSHDAQVAQAGKQLQQHFDALMQAVYAARQLKTQQQPVPDPAPLLDDFKQLCEQHQDAPQERVGAVAREFLYDWDVIMRPLAQPHLPLTNNTGERQVRHHVLMRRMSFGTRCPAGSRAYAWLASVFDTCRLRGASTINTLSQTIHAARRGLPVPALPPIPQHLLGTQAVYACPV